MVKVLLTALAFVAPFTPAYQVHDDFTTFAPASTFNDAFGDLTGYVLSSANLHELGHFYIDYMPATYFYYAFPINYDIVVSANPMTLYYSNDYFNFYLNEYEGIELDIELSITNYNGVEEDFYFGRLNTQAMTAYIENDPKLTTGVIDAITQWVTGSIGILTAGLTSFVSVFYNSTTSKLTAIGTLALLGLAVGLVTLIIAFVRRLFER